jgi:hypothetical protein
MTEIKQQPPLVVFTPPPKKRNFSGGIVPGSLSGRRPIVSMPVEEENEHSELLKRVGKMGTEFRAWKKDPDNARALDAALRWKSEQGSEV